MTISNVSDWYRDWVRLGKPTDATEIVRIMQRGGMSKDNIATTLQTWMDEQPDSEAEAPSAEKTTLEKLISHISTPNEVRAMWNQLSAAEKAKVESEIRPHLAATSAPTTAPTRPYRYRSNSYQKINNTWQQVELLQDRTIKVIKPAPRYYVNDLNVLKKKVDAQRASGNLTDWKVNVGKPIIESMTPFLRPRR
jgi:hypothetical protein